MTLRSDTNWTKSSFPSEEMGLPRAGEDRLRRQGRLRTLFCPRGQPQTSPLTSDSVDSGDPLNLHQLLHLFRPMAWNPRAQISPAQLSLPEPCTAFGNRSHRDEELAPPLPIQGSIPHLGALSPQNFPSLLASSLTAPLNTLTES